MLHDSTGSYTPDMAEMIDTEEEILADDMGVTLKQARAIMRYKDDAVRRNESLTLARAIGLMLQSNNLPVTVHAMAIAAGLDQLNGKRSQADIAKELGCTRALVSHYVVGIRDILSGKDSGFDCFKFRKSQGSREIYRKQATDPFTAAKSAAKKRHKENQVKSYIIISTDGRRFIFQARDKIENGVVIKTAKDNAIHQAEVDGIDVKTAKLA